MGTNECPPDWKGLTWVCECGAVVPGHGRPPHHYGCVGSAARSHRRACSKCPKCACRMLDEFEESNAAQRIKTRTFTREEVLTVLKARRAMMNTTASTDAARHNELGDLMQLFERME